MSKEQEQRDREDRLRVLEKDYQKAAETNNVAGMGKAKQEMEKILSHPDHDN